MSFSLGDYTIVEIESITMTAPTESEQEQVDKLEKERDLQFFSVERVRKEVPEAEVDEFVKNYPRKLTVDVCGISDPPSISFYDRELSDDITYARVAHKWAWDDDPDGYFYEPKEKRTGWILANAEEVFKNKIPHTKEETERINNEYDNKINAIRRTFSGGSTTLTDIEPLIISRDE